ncbi:hypothetical protein AB833_26030 [Chromatiales bacterium (ex Bugula neritina AB1)]|nr:hypothetical protein AB833_26030 [Chromatiales bacterium (ex Bugula neritina AB1)]
MRIPLFPLSSIVLPEGLLPLRLFERRYLDMVRDCFRLQSGFGVCLLQQGNEVGNAAIPYPYGTLVKIVDWDQSADGLLNVVVCGEQKFRIRDTSVEESQLLTGEIELLPWEQPASVPEELNYLQDSMQQILRQIESSIVYDEPKLDDALWLGSRFVELLPLPAEVKHELASLDDAVDRLKAVAQLLTGFTLTARE